MIDWNDLHYFHIMSETGSLSAAAKKLKVSQPTLSRRLTALEEQAGNILFLRTRNGLELTQAGEALIDHAAHMQHDAYAIERLITGQSPDLDGEVVISAIESIGARWLIPQLAPFQKKYPKICLDVRVENAVTDLMKHEADIAIRMFRPSQGDLIARKMVPMRFGLYAHKDYLAARGTPKSLEDIANHDVIMPSRDLIDSLGKEHFINAVNMGHIVVRSNNMTALAGAVSIGMGIGVNSCLLARQNPDLVRIMPEMVLFETEVWLVTHPDLRRSARIRATFDFLGDLIMANKKSFAGE